MSAQVAAILLQDGIATGAIYALLAVALVLIFLVTRIIFIPQGDLVAFAALTFGSLQDGRFPGVIWLLAVLLSVALIWDVANAVVLPGSVRWRDSAIFYIAPTVLTCVLLWLCHRYRANDIVSALVSVVAVVPVSTLSYRLFYQAISGASTLVLFIASVAVHVVVVGSALFVFGADGNRAAPIVQGQLTFGDVIVSGQSILIVLAALLAGAVLYLFFTGTFYGKALQATAENSLGARLHAIRVETSSQISFLMAGLLAGVAGVLIAPTAVVYYDTGFLIGLKGFVAAIIGALASFPLALFGAFAVGLIEIFSSFYASLLKEIIVFSMLIPVLFWRSYLAHSDTERD